MTQAIVPSPDVRLDTLIDLTVARLNSPHSRRAYARALREFIAFWNEKHGKEKFSRPLVQTYRTKLVASKKRSSSINLALSAIRTLAEEAALYGWLSDAEAHAIASVKNVPRRGVRLGNWLTLEQTKALFAEPDRGTARGQRDFLVLALLAGCGMRRAEIASLRVSHVTIRDGRLLLKDVLGKGGRVRSVPIPAWAWETLQTWLERLGEGDKWLLPRFHQEQVSNTPLSENGIMFIVKRYAARIGCPDIAPHDLRRTFARLAKNGGADLMQIQHTLGHASVKTTEQYIASALDLANPACDFLGVK